MSAFYVLNDANDAAGKLTGDAPDVSVNNTVHRNRVKAGKGIAVRRDRIFHDRRRNDVDAHSTPELLRRGQSKSIQTGVEQRDGG